MLAYEVRVKNSLWRVKKNIKEAVHDFFTDEQGDTNLISIIIVLVIVLALAIVFRKNIANLVNGLWSKIFSDAGTATGGTFESEAFE